MDILIPIEKKPQRGVCIEKRIWGSFQEGTKFPSTPL